ncbi:hypothetical protein CYMTET_24377 [Cymbomonas tetramitiformis]|uniref:Uncharacterized protein n=1 Tax=Cymbomonas tetramitiformis TaxID=36881 RepID=A0AAE0FW83_9CHLO|nr:hypothetical protein CYMTET_24377 [Cymbomonas tetramitiformis]
MDEIVDVSMLYPDILDTGLPSDITYSSGFDYINKTVFPFDFHTGFQEVLRLIRDNILRSNSVITKTFWQQHENAVVDFLAKKQTAKRPHSPQVQIRTTREAFLGAMTDDLINGAHWQGDMLQFDITSTHTLECVMGDWRHVTVHPKNVEREAYIFELKGDCALLYRPTIDGDRYYFAMGAVVKKKTNGAVQWDTRKCYEKQGQEVYDDSMDLAVFLPIRD